MNESIEDKCDLSASHVRFKVIIDPSEDNSVVSFLFKYGILTKRLTKQFSSSELFGDKELQKVNKS